MKSSLLLSLFATLAVISLLSSSVDVFAMNTSTTMVSTTSPEFSTTSQVVSTTTTAPPTTTTQAPPSIPSVTLIVTLLNSTIITTPEQLENFKDEFANALNISSSYLSISAGTQSGTVNIVITAANASAIAQQAINLPKSVLEGLGAAAVAEAPAGSTTAAPHPADKPLNIGLIAGCAAGGVVILLILLYVAKKKSSEGTGVADSNVTFQQSPDGTTFKKMEDEMNTHRQKKNYGTEQL